MPTATGELYHCVTDDGHLHVQGLPCTKPGTPADADGPRQKDGLIRMWVNARTSLVRPAGDYHRSEPTGDSPQPTKQAFAGLQDIEYDPPVVFEPRVQKRVAVRPVAQLTAVSNDSNLPSCSIQFYQCTAEPGRLMDACVNRISVCQNGKRANCCNQSYITRFQQLRATDHDRQSATRLALLGEPGS